MMRTSGWTWSQFLTDAKRLTGGGDYGYGGVYGTGTGLGVGLELAYDLTGTPDAYVRSGTFNLTNPPSSRGSSSRPNSPIKTTSHRRPPRRRPASRSGG